jgi:hypothetical protein
LVVLGGGDVAWADPTREAAPPTWVNFRIGASTSVSRAFMCAEVGGLWGVSFEGCGTGSGFLHSEPQPEISHFRAKWAPGFVSRKIGDAWLVPAIGLGFAELQIDEDQPGFQFGGTDATRTSTAGFEAMASVRLVLPAGKGIELIGDLAFSLARFPHATELVTPREVWQPGVAITVGLGY